MASMSFEGPRLTGEGRTISTVEMPDQALLLAIQGMCHAYKYQPTVPNPDYDPNDPESEQTVPNPTGPGEFAIGKILAFCSENVAAMPVQGVAELVAERNANLQQLQDFKVTFKDVD